VRGYGFAVLFTISDRTQSVLSHNKVNDLSSLKRLKLLKKVSAAHNQLRELPDLSKSHQLTELRLNDNRLARLPPTLANNIK
jgi:Leucine-rich repeat (LRR) protein